MSGAGFCLEVLLEVLFCRVDFILPVSRFSIPSCVIFHVHNVDLSSPLLSFLQAPARRHGVVRDPCTYVHDKMAGDTYRLTRPRFDLTFGRQIELAAGGQRPLCGGDSCARREDISVQPHRQGYRFRGSFAQGAGLEVTADKTDKRMLGRAWSSSSTIYSVRSKLFRRQKSCGLVQVFQQPRTTLQRLFPE